jgi:hypothetical protein
MTDVKDQDPIDLRSAEEPSIAEPVVTGAPPVLVGETVPPPPNPVQDDLRVGPPTIAPRVPREPSPLAPAWLIAAGAAAIAADVALRRAPWNNVAATILIVTLAAGLLASGYLRTGASRFMAGAAVFFSLFLALRTEPILTTFNVFAACGLLVFAAIHGQGRSFWNLRPFRLFADAVAVLYESVVGIGEVPAEIGARYRVAKEQAEAKETNTMYAVMRGLAIAVPVVLVLGLLLASADAVFQSFFSGFGAVDAGALIGHLVLLVIGAYAMMVLIRLAATEGGDEPTERAPSLGHIEALVILISVNLLFAAFAVAQLMTVLGGAEDALGRAGLDPKQFARQGFFQLLWVAGLTLGLLMTLHVVTRGIEAARSAVRALSLLTVALTLAIVAVAFTRISFYINDGGQTPLRLYSAVFCLWVAVAFVAVAARIWGYRPSTAWLLPLLLVSGLIMLGGLNVANPESIIAHDNINRDHDALFWHVEQGQFTGDGQAVLASNIDRLSPDLAERVTESVCEQYSWYDYQSGWLNFNLGKWRAENSVPELCG